MCQSERCLAVQMSLETEVGDGLFGVPSVGHPRPP